MTTIVTIDADDSISSSRSDINTNFANLNSDKIETSVIDTDTTLSANSDSKIPSQKAVKAYVDSGGNPFASTTQAGIVEEATQAELTAGTTTGGSGARLFINPTHTVSTSSGAGDAGKIPRLNSSGVLDQTIVSLSKTKSYSVVENMNGSTTPQAVCINSDGYIQLAEADQTGILDKFIGFCTENITTAEQSFINTNQQQASATYSFTANAGTDRVLLVQVGIWRSTPNVTLPSGVTWNGNSMTLVDTTNPDSTVNSTYGQAVYAIAIGTSGTNQTENIVVSGAGYTDITIQAIVYDKVDQTTPVPTKAKANGSSSNASVALNPTASFCRVVNFLCTDTVTPTWNDGQTQRSSDLLATGGIRFYISDVLNKTSASVTYDATLSGSNTWGIQAIELKPSSSYPTSNIQIIDKLTFSGLTPNAKYYLSNTAGAISTTPGATSVLLGKALSATELLIIQN